MFKKITFACLIIAAVFAISPAITRADTSADLQTKIAAMLAEIKVLQAKLAQQQGIQPVAWCHNFNSNLGVGGRGQEVSALISALKKENIEVDDSESYGESLAAAISEFQEKYKDEILTPNRLKRGTGYLGASTRKKLNELYGCGKKQIYPTTTTITPTVTPPMPIYYPPVIATTTPQICPQYSPQAPCGVGYHKITTTNSSIDASGCRKPAVYTCVADKETTTSSITVQVPKEGETWTVGGTQMIGWSVTGSVSNVLIQLVKDQSTASPVTLANGTSAYGGGVYQWTIPATVSGGLYKIKITSVNSFPQVEDFSESFSIVSGQITQPSIIFISPAGGEKIIAGELIPVKIKIMSNKVGSIKVWAASPNGETLGGGIISLTQKDFNPLQSSYLLDMGLGSSIFAEDMKIVAKWMSSDGVENIQSESAVFSTVKTVTAQPSITVLSPNGGEVMDIGKIHTIGVASSFIKEPVMLQLYRNDAYLQNIASYVYTTGDGSVSYNWTVPANLTVGGGYKIRAVISKESTASSYPQDFSDAPFSITSQPISIETCTDSDGGYDIYKKGYTNWTSSKDGVKDRIMYDKCVIQTQNANGYNYMDVASCKGSENCFVWEQTCLNNREAAGQMRCQNGCSNGVCLQLPATLGSLNVSLDSTTPSARSIVVNTENVLLTALKFTATGENVDLNRLALQFNGSNPDAILDYSVWDGGTQIGTGYFVGGGTYSTTTLSSNIIVPANGSKVLLVKAHLSPVGVGQSAQAGDTVSINYDGNDTTGTYGVGESSGTTVYSSTRNDTSAPLATLIAAPTPPVVDVGPWTNVVPVSSVINAGTGYGLNGVVGATFAYTGLLDLKTISGPSHRSAVYANWASANNGTVGLSQTITDTPGTYVFKIAAAGTTNWSNTITVRVKGWTNVAPMNSTINPRTGYGLTGLGNYSGPVNLFSICGPASGTTCLSGRDRLFTNWATASNGSISTSQTITEASGTYKFRVAPQWTTSTSDLTEWSNIITVTVNNLRVQSDSVSQMANSLTAMQEILQKMLQGLR